MSRPPKQMILKPMAQETEDAEQASPPQPPFETSWSFAEMVVRVSRSYRPGSLNSGRARNAVIESWAAAVGGTRALRELNQAIRVAGSKRAAAKQLHMSSSTLAWFLDLFASLPDPPEEIQNGLLLFFGDLLHPVERWLVEALVIAVLGPRTGCRLVEVSEIERGQVLRFANATVGELRQVAESLWDRIWRAPRALESEDAIVAGLTKQQLVLEKLDDVRERLLRIELRSMSEDALEMLDDQGRDHVRRKDAQSVQTWGQRAAAMVGRTVRKKSTRRRGQGSHSDDPGRVSI